MIEVDEDYALDAGTSDHVGGVGTDAAEADDEDCGLLDF